MDEQNVGSSTSQFASSHLNSEFSLNSSQQVEEVDACTEEQYRLEQQEAFQQQQLAKQQQSMAMRQERRYISTQCHSHFSDQLQDMNCFQYNQHERQPRIYGAPTQLQAMQSQGKTFYTDLRHQLSQHSGHRRLGQQGTEAIRTGKIEHITS